MWPTFPNEWPVGEDSVPLNTGSNQSATMITSMPDLYKYMLQRTEDRLVCPYPRHMILSGRVLWNQLFAYKRVLETLTFKSEARFRLSVKTERVYITVQLFFTSHTFPIIVIPELPALWGLHGLELQMCANCVKDVSPFPSISPAIFSSIWTQHQRKSFPKSTLSSNALLTYHNLLFYPDSGGM